MLSMNPDKIPKHKVELHVHLDGSPRFSTLWEIARDRDLNLGFNSIQQLQELCTVKNPSTLEKFLEPFSIILPIISGDVYALERIAYEFCEDAANESILYVETRYSPHLLTGPGVTAREVVLAISKGLDRGSEKFGITARSILTCIRGRSEWSEEVLQLCYDFKGQGVVGIDLCGDQNASVQTTDGDIDIFQRAASMGIHRTVHAGENGPAEQVLLAIEKLLAERIGHGYHSVDDNDIYDTCQQRGIHFEACPISSILTGSVKGGRKHPIVRFAEDNANFSISRDNPVIQCRSLEDNNNFLRGFGVTDLALVRANFNAAHSSFLPEDEKHELLKKLKNIYGVEKHC